MISRITVIVLCGMGYSIAHGLWAIVFSYRQVRHIDGLAQDRSNFSALVLLQSCAKQSTYRSMLNNWHLVTMYKQVARSYTYLNILLQVKLFHIILQVLQDMRMMHVGWKVRWVGEVWEGHHLLGLVGPGSKGVYIFFICYLYWSRKAYMSRNRILIGPNNG